MPTQNARVRSPRQVPARGPRAHWTHAPGQARRNRGPGRPPNPGAPTAPDHHPKSGVSWTSRAPVGVTRSRKNPHTCHALGRLAPSLPDEPARRIRPTSPPDKPARQTRPASSPGKLARQACLPRPLRLPSRRVPWAWTLETPEFPEPRGTHRPRPPPHVGCLMDRPRAGRCHAKWEKLSPPNANSRACARLSCSGRGRQLHRSRQLPHAEACEARRGQEGAGPGVVAHRGAVAVERLHAQADVRAVGL